MKDSNKSTKPRREAQDTTRSTAPISRKRRGRHFLRFEQAVGKTVEFVEMYTAADFPCIEIGFSDKTALYFTMETRIAMEPCYADWKTGNQRVLSSWPEVECR